MSIIGDALSRLNKEWGDAYKMYERHAHLSSQAPIRHQSPIRMEAKRR